MQAHANQKLEDLGAQLTEQTDAATGAKAKVDQLQATVDAIQKQLDDNQKEIDTLHAGMTEQQKKIDALNQMWKLERLWQQGETDDARAIIQKMDETYTRTALTDKNGLLGADAASEYAKICRDLGV